MAKTANIEVKNQDILKSLREFFRSVLQLEDISAILVPLHLPMKNVVMPALITDPVHLDDADPLAPVFPMNGAKLVSRLTRKPVGGKIAVVLRSCEIRAYVELVKLKQGTTDETVILGTDCLGAYNNKDYLKFAGDDGKGSTVRFCESVLSGKGAAINGVDMATACKVCEYPVADGADISIGLLGMDTKKNLMAKALTLKGEELLNSLGLPQAGEPGTRKEAVESLVAERKTCRDKMFAQTSEATGSLEKLTTYLANCINCYNCRVACPVCYCKECVFVTDVFNHEPSQYLQWARRKGVIKMPTDTIFYHITRMAHISTACVGCGQCSNACPNDIPVMELFRTVARRTQKAFDYEAGKNPEQAPPLSEFREQELSDVVGIN